MAPDIIHETKLEGIELFYQGKVRDLYAVDDKLLIVASDRISAFDYILPTPIPEKGKILTKISLFWFKYLENIIPNHVITADVDEYPDELQPYKDILRDRSMLVRKTQRINIECVVRGYLAGSGWKDYQESSSVCGISLPEGLKESARLDKLIFTPATKARTGSHDINITEQQLIDNVGLDISATLKEKSILLYKKARDYADFKGIIIADTKFEFGRIGDEIILIDEILTPDSSRFWDKQLYQPGRSQDSFDKQFVRDYLESIKWNKEPPVPELPPHIVKQTRQKYLDAYRRLSE